MGGLLSRLPVPYRFRSKWPVLKQTTRTTVDLAAEISQVGSALGDSFDALIAGVAAKFGKTRGLAKRLGVDKGLMSRISKAISSRDPVALMYLIPGPDPLRRVTAAAKDLGLDEEIIQAADASILQFSSIIESVAGDRAKLNGIVSQLLPESREHFENRVRQQLYRGYSQLKGYSVDLDFTTIFIKPSEQPNCLDYIVITGILGLHRLRPYVNVRLAAWVARPGRKVWEMTTLDGAPLNDITNGRLDRYCTSTVAEVSLQQFGAGTYCCLADNKFGPNSSVDFVLGHFCRLDRPATLPNGQSEWLGPGVEIDKPTKRLHFDAFLHHSLYPQATPQLFMIDTSFRGMASLDDESRIPDRMEHRIQVQMLGANIDRLRTSNIPRYSEMLHDVLGRRGWNADEFRAYRVALQYPIYGMQLTLGFKDGT